MDVIVGVLNHKRRRLGIFSINGFRIKKGVVIRGLTCVEIFFGSLAIHEEGGADFVPGVSQVWPLDSISYCTLLKTSWQINDVG